MDRDLEEVVAYLRNHADQQLVDVDGSFTANYLEHALAQLRRWPDAKVSKDNHVRLLRELAYLLYDFGENMDSDTTR